MDRMFFNVGNKYPDFTHLQGVEVIVGEYSSNTYTVYFLSGWLVSGVYPKDALSPGWPSLRKTLPSVEEKKEPETYIALWGSGSSFCDGEVMSKELIEDYLNDVPNLKPLNIRECYLKGLVKVARITFIEPTKKTIKKEVLCVD